MSAEKPAILFVGIGKMGHPMARRLNDAGFPLAVADLAPAALAAFDRDVPRSATPGALDGELVITMLPTDKHVDAALFGAGGALERPRRAVIDMSSSAPAGSRRIAERLRERGIAFLDAPVSGGVRGAQRGTLTAMIGGDAGVLASYRPVLERMCKTLVHVGPTAAGVTIKALNNFLAAVGLWATSEALVVGAKAGLDPATMIDVWRTSSGRNDAIESKAPVAILPRTFDYGFSVGLMAKDLGIAAGIARDVDVAAPLLAEHAATWALAREALGFDRDMTAVITLIESWAGYEVPAVEPS
jgi:3-hydroxyisobutyrate dehydrogenase